MYANECQKFHQTPIGLAKGNADILSDNYLKQSQNNTVVTVQIKMDRVGVEPTTSAMPIIDKKSLFKPHAGPIYYYLY